MKRHLNDHTHYTIYDKKMSKLQTVLRKSFNYMKDQYEVIIFGDTGKREIRYKVMPRVLIDTLGKGENIKNINMIIIIDDDGVRRTELENKFGDNLKSVLRDPSKFNRLPKLVEDSWPFIITPSRGRGDLRVRLLIVPESLEMQIFKKAVEKHKYSQKKAQKILNGGLDEAIRCLALNHYAGNKERLIRESTKWLKDEEWVEDVLSVLNT